MDNIAHWSAADREELFREAAFEKGISPAIVEKDFWVCWLLGKLFADNTLRNKILLKGGTSLSKVFGLIDRFSEDIDLILDWNEVVDEDPYMERSKTKQDRFNKAISDITRVYLKDTFLPAVGNLVADVCEVFISPGAPDIVAVRYPISFKERYLRPIMAERTFWEKATILHQEAHRLKGKPQPPRYSRHYYDLAMMARSADKAGALEDLVLLRADVEFKRKFYPSSWARYEFARPGTFRLVPPEHVHRTLERDYRAMRIMIFGEAPAFDRIMNDMKDLEEEINLQAQTTLQKGVAT